MSDRALVSQSLWKTDLAQTLRQRDERLAALKQLARRMAHDFRNLLVPARGYAGMLVEELSSQAALFAYLPKLEKSFLTAEETLEAILTAIRPERRYACERTDLAELTRTEIEAWRGGSDPSPAMVVHTNLAACELWVDRTHFRGLMAELLKNARQALSVGGSVNIMLERYSLNAAEAELLRLDVQDGCRLVVQDSGCGMSAEVLAQACDPFFSTRSKGQASGLGLTLVHGIVLLHRGQLIIDSAPGQGTTVTIWLPEGSSTQKSAD